MASTSTKSKPSHLYSSISVAIVMFLLGLFVLILLHSHNLTNLIKEKMNIVAELADGTEKSGIVKAIKSFPQIRDNSVSFISKEEALKTMGSNLQIDFDSENNPFKDVVIFNVRAENYSVDVLKSIKLQLEKMDGVLSVYYEDLTIKNIKTNLTKVAYAIFFVGLIFIFLAVVIIRNTINLSMYADRWEIKTMELVGAKWNFIKMPYIKTSVIVGFRAFLIAAVLILSLLAAVYLYIPRAWEVVNLFFVFIALGAIFVLSIIIPAMTTNAASNKYLNKQISAMYE
ncbi:MAG: permease-like cell division protein FtsX [Bacteroidota bacterium]